MNYYGSGYSSGYQYPQSQPMLQNNSNTMLFGTYVNTIEDVQRFTVPQSGEIFFFPNLQNKCIYTKQFNFLDGSVSMKQYTLVEPQPQQQVQAIQQPQTAVPQQEYATKEDLQMILDELKNLKIQLGE